ncbi:MAG: HlyD family efflux transporter periplasmic adaptor subunit [Niameybacter sp.]
MADSFAFYYKTTLKGTVCLFFIEQSSQTLARLNNPLYDDTIKENIGSEQMKKTKTKNEKRKTQKHSPNGYSNNEGKGTYNLDEYRSKKRNYYNPYGSEQQPVQSRETTHPYRKQYTSSSKASYTNPYEEAYTPRSSSGQNPYQNHTPSQNPYSQSTYNGSNQPYTSESNYGYQKPIETQTPEQRKAELRNKNKVTRKQAQQQAKRRKKRMVKKTAMIMIMVMFMSYAGIRAVDFFMYPSVSYQTVQRGMIDNSNLYNGVIFREEKVYESSKTGDVHYIVGESEKVAKDGSVCLVAKSAEIEALKKQLYTIDDTLYNKQDKRSDLSYYQTDVKQVNDILKMEMANFVDSKYWENPKSVYALRQSLDKTIEERTALYVQDDSKATEGLKGARTEVLESLKNNQAALKAPLSGIVSYSLDGYEKSLGQEALEGMTYENYKAIIGSLKQFEVTMPPLQTEASTPLYKIITADKWKILTYVDSDDALSYEVGKYYDLYFDNTKRECVRFKLESKEGGEKTQLVLSSNEYLVDFLNNRQVAFSIGQNKAEGIKIPTKAIIEKNILTIPKTYIVEQGSEKGVLRTQGQTNVFTPINIQYDDEENVYIMQQIEQLQGVGLGTVLAHPEQKEAYTVSEMETVQGVYVVNGQFAQFKRIAIQMVNDEYAILKSNKENKLKEFDQIISNPKNIREDQLLKYMNVQNE